MKAAEVLRHRLDVLADAGTPTPCTGQPDGPWLSEDPEVRAVAATWCEQCPLIVECDDAARELRVTFGVWAGRDRTRRQRGAHRE